MTTSLNKDLEKQLYHDLTQGQEDIEDVTREPNRQQQQDMVQFLKEAEDAVRSFMLHRQVHVDSLLRSFIDKVDMGYIARETSSYWPLIRSRISHIKIEYSIYFLSTKKGGRKPSTCNNRMVSTRNMTTC